MKQHTESNKNYIMNGSFKRQLDPSRSSPPVIPQASSLHLRRRQLENNQIKHIQLGFYESCFTFGDYSTLCKAIRRNKSLRAVEIGWELPRQTLLKILESVARLPYLESLSLISYTNLPRRLLRRLVSKPTLRHLELRNIAIGPSPWKERLVLNTTGKISVNYHAHQSVSRLLDSFSDSIRSLHLVACDLQDDDVTRICKWTESRTQPLDELSLAYSTAISAKSVAILCTRAACRQLDLTSCGLSDKDASVMARCLAQSKTIENLVVARNRLWGSQSDPTGCTSRPGFDEFVQVALHHLKGLDVSFCSLSLEQVQRILQELVPQDNHSECCLESLSMLGIPKGCEDDPTLLLSILKNNTVLRSLRLYPTTDLYCTPSCSDEVMGRIENCLADNYTLEWLQIGPTSLVMDLFLSLNRAGRRCLRHDLNDAPVDWAHVLGQGSGHPDVLFWLLQNGVDKIFSQRATTQ